MQIRKILLVVLLPFQIVAMGQDYSGSAGFRGGYSAGINFKGFVDEYKAVEALVSWRNGGMQFAMLAESYRPILLEYSEHIFMYSGYGAHAGYTRWYERYTGTHTINGNPTYFYQRRVSPVIGADAILGLEYRMYRIPLALSLDVKPYIEFFGERFIEFMPADMAFSLRITF